MQFWRERDAVLKRVQFTKKMSNKTIYKQNFKAEHAEVPCTSCTVLTCMHWKHNCMYTFTIPSPGIQTYLSKLVLVHGNLMLRNYKINSKKKNKVQWGDLCCIDYESNISLQVNLCWKLLEYPKFPSYIWQFSLSQWTRWTVNIFSWARDFPFEPCQDLVTSCCHFFFAFLSI